MNLFENILSQIIRSMYVCIKPSVFRYKKGQQTVETLELTDNCE